VILFLIHLVRKESDVFDENNVFKPDMTHQLFGERLVFSSLLERFKDNEMKDLVSCTLLSLLQTLQSCPYNVF